MKRDTILIFEDNEIEREMLVELFKSDYKILEAEDGREGLALLNRNLSSIAIVLMDCVMPVMDGYHAAKEIRACAHPDAKTIPIAAMTANAFAEDVQKSLSAGMNIHISKPVNMDVLKSAVLKLV